MRFIALFVIVMFFMAAAAAGAVYVGVVIGGSKGAAIFLGVLAFFLFLFAFDIFSRIPDDSTREVDDED